MHVISLRSWSVPAKMRLERPFARSSRFLEYFEVFGVLGMLTFAGWFLPVSYHIFGHAYLLAVIILSVRVGRWPALLAGLVSAVAWNYVFIPPRLSFSVVNLDDLLLLGTYLFVALIGSQLTGRIREQEHTERILKQRATALLHLTRAMGEARQLDDAVAEALRQAGELFGASTALLLAEGDGPAKAHPAGSYSLSEQDYAIAQVVWRNAQDAGRFTSVLAGSAVGLHVPLLRGDSSLGVFSLRFPDDVTELTSIQRQLIDGFATQIAQVIEREQLRAAREREKLLVESSRLHRTLLDSVSHELKTPLAVLRGATGHLAKATGARQAELTDEIRIATARLEHLVANLLSQTRLEAGRLQAQLDCCDARDLVTAARRSIAPALGVRPVQFSVQEGVPLVLADAVLMEQVLANLLLNVAQHTPAETPVEIIVGHDREHSRVSISVVDHGPGIPAELRSHLFQKFWRGQTAAAGGLGLGLSIVRGFVDAQGGEVTAEDEPGGGARFTVSLPVADHEQVPNE